MPHEIGEQLRAVRRMHHLRMELRGVETLFLIGGDGIGRALADRHHLETRGKPRHLVAMAHRSEEHTSELQSLMRISYAVFCLKKKKQNTNDKTQRNRT